MDLFRDDVKIAIQWETAPDAKKATKQGISTEYVRDITTYAQEGKMLFGWAIDSRITENPGNIKFSVRFYHFDAQKKLDFSLNTLTATAKINPSIDYKFDENGQSSVDIIDSSNIIKNRLENSVTPDSVVKDAKEPIFVDGYNIPKNSDIIGDPINIGEGDEARTYYIIDLEKDYINGGDDFYRFEAQAYAEDEGIISYKWGRADFNGKEFYPLEQLDDYVKANDTKYSKNYNYYKQVFDVEDPSKLVGYQVVVLTPNQLDADIPVEEQELLYRKISTCTVGETGDYRVVAVNGLGFSTAETESRLVRIPGPDAATFTVSPAPQEEPIAVLLEGENIGVASIVVAAGTAEARDKISYTWVVDGETLTDLNVVEAEHGTTTKYELEGVDPADRPTFESFASVTTYASRNGDVTNSKIVTFRITDVAHDVTIDVGDTSLDIETGIKKELYATASTLGRLSDKLEYQWFKLRGDIDDENPMDDEDKDDIPVNETPIEATVKVEGNEYKYIVSQEIDVPGTYYCKVINHVNGSECATISDLFRVSSID